MIVLPAQTPLWRVYEYRFGYDQFNPGSGSSRFAPLTDQSEVAIPTLYLGANEVVVLLEAVFHEVGLAGERVIYERSLRERGLAYVQTPSPLRLLDFRDPVLRRVGIARTHLVVADAQHYPCTREWGEWAHGLSQQGGGLQGMLWHSRQSELLGSADPQETMVLFGDRASSGPGSYPLAGPGVVNLLMGPGRLFVERVAERLDARIEPLGLG